MLIPRVPFLVWAIKHQKHYTSFVTLQATPIRCSLRRVAQAFDQHIGANLALLRKAKGYSQSDLALLLEQHGLPFQQQTILKIEKGARPLKLQEALTVAEVLDADLAALTQTYGNDAIAAVAAEILQRAAAINRMRKSREEYREKLRRDDEDFERTMVQWTRELRDVEQRLAEAGAVKDGDGRWKWRNEDGSYSYLTVDV
jgi:transcriptional regulator with XRE-family HTH domain